MSRHGKITHICLLFTLLPLSDCELITDLAHMSPPEIISFSPASEYADPAEVEKITITFSTIMDRTKTEEAFALKEESENLQGKFMWQDNTLIFTPYGEIGKNKTFTILMKKDAEDLYGNSLKDDFRHTFFTGEELVPPQVINFSPQNGETLKNLNEPVVVTFSERMEIESIYNGFRLNPDVKGTFEWSEDGKIFTFTPVGLYRQGEEYTVEISTDLRDLSGNSLAESLLFSFLTEGGEKPEIISVKAESKNAGKTDELIPTEERSLNTGLNKDDRILLTFNTPVPLEERSYIFGISPSVPFTLDWKTDFKEGRVQFQELLEYGEIYTLTVDDKEYRVEISGDRSVPVKVRALTFCKDISQSVPTFQELHLNDLLIVDDGKTGSFDFYLGHSSESVIDISTFLDAFQITTENNCLSLEFLDIEVDPAVQQSDPPPKENETVIRITANIEDNLVSGVVTISLDRGVKDSLGNLLNEKYTMQVNK